MYTQSPSYTTLYFVISFFLGNRFRSTRPSAGHFFLLKAHMTSNKMYALQLKIIRSQRYNIACDTVTYYGIPFTLEKCFLKIKVLKWVFRSTYIHTYIFHSPYFIKQNSLETWNTSVHVTTTLSTF